jgi:hypothetical protein
MELGIRRQSLQDPTSDRTLTGLKSLRDLICFGVPGLRQTRLHWVWGGMEDPSLLLMRHALRLMESACFQQEAILEHARNLLAHYRTPVSAQTSVSQGRPDGIIIQKSLQS